MNAPQQEESVIAEAQVSMDRNDVQRSERCAEATINGAWQKTALVNNRIVFTIASSIGR